MTVYLFAGIPVSDFAAALAWYERLLGGPPSFVPARHRSGLHGNEIGFGEVPAE